MTGRIVGVLLVVAIVAVAIGATQVLVEVPMAGGVRFSGLSWGGNLRSGLLAGLLIGGLILLLLRQPLWSLLLTSIAFGFLCNVGFGARQWYEEKVALLEGAGLMSAATNAAMAWKWPVFAWGIAGLTILASSVMCIFLIKERNKP